jgi:hypothetical protein
MAPTSSFVTRQASAVAVIATTLPTTHHHNRTNDTNALMCVRQRGQRATIVACAKAMVVVWAFAYLCMLPASGRPVKQKKNRHVEIFDEIPQNTQARVDVLLISLGRGGSTHVSNLFSAFANTFTALEPYYNFRTTETASSAPTYEEILSCAVWRTASAANRVASPYFCDYYKAVQQTMVGRLDNESSHTLHYRCRHGNMTEADASALHEQCTQARVAIVKTIRFDRHHSIDPAAHPSLIWMYIVRSPWKIFRSR